MPPNDPLVEGLEKLAAHALGGGTVRDAARLSGGASQETWRFTLEKAGRREHLVLRRTPGGSWTERPTAVGLDREAAVITAVASHGVPVPTVRYVLQESDGVGRGFVTDLVEGDALPARLLRDSAYAALRPKLAFELGRILADIHAAPIPDIGLRRLSAASVVDDLERRYQGIGVPRPTFSLALIWLRDHLPPEGKALRLVHGDFRTGNFIAGPEGVRAVLDWEGVHVGDPLSDLGYLCVNSWRFGMIDKPAGGFGSREQLFDGYEAAAGIRPDPAQVCFWEVVGGLRWWLVCAAMTERFRAGDGSVERGAIGRRTSETEIDILRLIAPRTRTP